jgi:hypothetical protein
MFIFTHEMPIPDHCEEVTINTLSTLGLKASNRSRVTHFIGKRRRLQHVIMAIYPKLDLPNNHKPNNQNIYDNMIGSTTAIIGGFDDIKIGDTGELFLSIYQEAVYRWGNFVVTKSEGGTQNNKIHVRRCTREDVDDIHADAIVSEIEQTLIDEREPGTTRLSRRNISLTGNGGH